MNNMERVLAVLDRPLTVEQISQASCVDRKSVAWALAKLRKHECVYACGQEEIKGGGYRKKWLATGKPYVAVRAAPTPKLFRIEVQHHKKIPGSGVIADRTYARGYLW